MDEWDANIDIKLGHCIDSCETIVTPTHWIGNVTIFKSCEDFAAIHSSYGPQTWNVLDGTKEPEFITFIRMLLQSKLTYVNFRVKRFVSMKVGSCVSKPGCSNDPAFRTCNLKNLHVTLWPCTCSFLLAWKPTSVHFSANYVQALLTCVLQGWGYLLCQTFCAIFVLKFALQRGEGENREERNFQNKSHWTFDPRNTFSPIL